MHSRLSRTVYASVLAGLVGVALAGCGGAKGTVDKKDTKPEACPSASAEASVAPTQPPGSGAPGQSPTGGAPQMPTMPGGGGGGGGAAEDPTASGAPDASGQPEASRQPGKGTGDCEPQETGQPDGSVAPSGQPGGGQPGGTNGPGQTGNGPGMPTMPGGGDN